MNERLPRLSPTNLQITIRKRKRSQKPSTFFIPKDNPLNIVGLYDNYMDQVPPAKRNGRFFKNISHGKFVDQPRGIHWFEGSKISLMLSESGIANSVNSYEANCRCYWEAEF